MMASVELDDAPGRRSAGEDVAALFRAEQPRLVRMASLQLGAEEER